MFGLKKIISGGEPRAYRQEIGSAWGGYMKTNDGMACGLVAGTLVATAMGWRPVEALTEGDLVLTFDNGMQRLRSVIRGTHWRADRACPQALWPLHVPAGALGNLDDMMVLPEQAIMVESDTADEMLDDPFALLSVSELDGVLGIERVMPQMEIDVITLQFDQDELVFAAAGALVLCPALHTVDMSELISAAPAQPIYRALSREEASILVQSLRVEDRKGENGFDPFEMGHAA